MLARKGEAFETVLHWYQTDGDKVLATGIQANIQRFIGRVFHNRNDGAFVRISMLSDKEHVQAATVLTKSFAEDILNLLQHYRPVES